MGPSLTELLKSKAIEIGFSKVGVTRARALTGEGIRLREWLARRYHATMQWMELNAEKRIDPKEILPGAKSVLCVALNYYTAVCHSDNPHIGKISRYAWGADYHDIMNERLGLILKFIKSVIPEANGKIYADTGPIMDKAWAVLSGIGWLGKHTNVITREIGSWIFLGEIILDIKLEYDEPATDLCGACTSCIDACPTQAIVQPYLLDSNKCISYLTVEHRDDFPAESVSKFRNWVYGCDICQEVCPWNRFQKETKEMAFQPRDENISPSLIELAAISKEEFSKRFRGSPIKRTKHSGLTRNARALLESIGNER